MANPLLNGLQSNFGAQKEGINRAKKLMQTMRSAKYPMQVINNEPSAFNVLQMFRGQNLKDVFYSLCKQSNTNPDEILNELR